MNKFLKEFTLYTWLPHLPSDFQDDFSNFFTTQLEQHLEGSLCTTVHSRFIDRHDPAPSPTGNWPQAQQTCICQSHIFAWLCLCQSSLKETCTILCLSWNHEDMELISSFQNYQSLTFKGTLFRSNEVVFTRTPGDMDCRPVIINYFALHAVYSDDSGDLHANGKDHFVKPVEIWWRDPFDVKMESFVPLHLLVCHSVCCEAKFEGHMINLIVSVQYIPNLL